MTILRALLFAAIVAAIAQSFAALALSLARTASLHAARGSARDALGAAPVAVQQIVASRLALGGDPLATIAPILSCTAIGANPCALRATTTIVLQANGTGAILQSNAGVDEARVAISLRSVVTDATGRTIVVANRNALLRTFARPPYASYEGDVESSGIAPSSTAAGTLVDVRYENAASGASMPGNIWRMSTAAPASAPPWPQ